jgi:hypothetical protein
MSKSPVLAPHVGDPRSGVKLIVMVPVPNESTVYVPTIFALQWI